MFAKSWNRETFTLILDLKDIRNILSGINSFFSFHFVTFLSYIFFSWKLRLETS